LSLLCATAMVQPVPVWETRPALVSNLHAVSAMRTNVGDVKLTFDIAKTTESVAVRNLDLKLTCHPLHAPDAAPVSVPRDENGKPTELAFPNNPVTIASAYLAWIGWWGVDKLELNETTWFSWEAEGVSGQGYHRLLKLDRNQVGIRTSLDLTYGKAKPMTMVWTGTYDAKTGAIRGVVGEVASVPQAEGYPMRVSRLNFSLLPGHVGRVMAAECDHPH